MSVSHHTPLRIGILGAARIARKFCDGVRGSEKIVASAVASRDLTRAAEFAHSLGIATVFESYDAMLASGDVDAIYNPLPNALHGPWSIRAMDAGKHVLCEKPLAATRAEAVEMFAAAARNGVRLAEAYPYRSQPQTLKLQELVAEGAIGTLQMITATFAFTLTARGDIRLDPALAGGALMDLGSYPVSLIRMLSGEAPRTMQALGAMDPSGVDHAAMATMSFASGLLAQASCSFGAAVHRQALIAGTDGVIETSYANHTSEDLPPILSLRRGRERSGVVETVRVAAMNGFRAEADAFADFVAGEPWTGIPEHESIDVAGMLDTLRTLVKANGQSSRA
jgi:predicted dehydrogenase